MFKNPEFEADFGKQSPEFTRQAMAAAMRGEPAPDAQRFAPYDLVLHLLAGGVIVLVSEMPSSASL